MPVRSKPGPPFPSFRRVRIGRESGRFHGEPIRILAEHGLRSRELIQEPGEHVGADLARYRSEEHTSEIQSLMRISYAVLCLKKKHEPTITHYTVNTINA